MVCLIHQLSTNYHLFSRRTVSETIHHFIYIYIFFHFNLLSLMNMNKCFLERVPGISSYALRHDIHDSADSRHRNAQPVVRFWVYIHIELGVASVPVRPTKGGVCAV